MASSSFHSPTHSLSFSLALPAFNPSTFLLLFVVLLSSPLRVISQLPTEVCPTFSCPLYGRGVCSEPKSGGFNPEGAGQFSTSYENVDGTDITKWQDCCQACTGYPASCAYWTHAILDDGTNVCHLFTTEICSGSSKTYIPCISDVVSNTGSNTTSGSMCLTATKVEGDPHYTGADNSRFDFTGLPSKTYCMLSDSHLHINVFHGGRFGQWGTNPHKPLTWIRQIALLWGHHVIYLAAREGSDWKYGNGYLKEITVDGTQVALEKPGDYSSFFDHQMKIKWVSGKKPSGDDEVDVYEIEIEGVIKMVLVLRPEIALLRTKDDGVVHFSIEIPKVSVSANVHGILGQTFRPDHQDRLYKQKLVRSDLLKMDVVPGDNGEGFLDGDVTDYETKDIFKPNCAFNRFARTDKIDEETASAIEISSQSGAESGYRYSLPRKMAVE